MLVMLFLTYSISHPLCPPLPIGLLQDTSPKLCEILQARLKAHRGSQLSSRPSPRALHLDPEFVNTPGGDVANQTLEHSLESFLDREDKMANSDSEAGLTPVRAVPYTPGQLHTEVNARNTMHAGLPLMAERPLRPTSSVCDIYFSARPDFSAGRIPDPHLPAVPYQLQGNAKFRKRKQQGPNSHLQHLPNTNGR